MNKINMGRNPMKSFLSAFQEPTDNDNKERIQSNLMKHAELIEEAEAKKHSLLLYDEKDDVYYILRRREELLKKYGIFAPNFENNSALASVVENAPNYKK